MKKTVLLSTILTAFAACAGSGEIRAPAGQLQELALQLGGQPGYFDTDNLITNEASFQHVLPVAEDNGVAGGVYLGVGPDQNFTYVAHRKPVFALLVDVRPDNQLLLLYLRTLFVDSADRWEYLGALLGRPAPPDRAVEASATELAAAFEAQPPDNDYFEKAFERSWSRLRAEVPQLVDEGDRPTLHRMASDFARYGLNLRFRSHGRPSRRDYPTLGRLLTETNGRGQQQHYLASEADYQFLRTMQVEQRIVPVVGDLAGSTALSRIAGLLRDRNLAVTTFYVSNVEFYLFSSGRFDKFASNVEALPADSRAIIIRSYFGYGFQHPLRKPGYRVTQVAQYISSFLENHRRNPYYGYADLVLRDYLE